MFPVALAPIAVGLLGGLAYLRVRKKNRELTPERKIILEQALDNEKDPAKLRALGEAFKQQGLENEGDLLLKRANIRELPPEVTVARKEVFINTMSSNDPDKVEKIAAAFEKEGATGAAATLNEYASNLRTGVVKPPPPLKKINTVGKAKL